MTWASQLGKYGIQAGGGGASPFSAHFLVIAGGGGGGNSYAGGGGAGGYRASTPEGPGGPSPSAMAQLAY